jgi:hypothetical protein
MFGAGMQLAPDNNPPLGQRKFFTDLGGHIPSGLFQGRCDELGADIPFGELFFIHVSTLLVSLLSTWSAQKKGMDFSDNAQLPKNRIDM